MTILFNASRSLIGDASLKTIACIHANPLYYSLDTLPFDHMRLS